MVKLRGSAAGLSYLHSRALVHGSGEVDVDLTITRNLTPHTVKCVSFWLYSSNPCRLKARRTTCLSLTR